MIGFLLYRLRRAAKGYSLLNTYAKHSINLTFDKIALTAKSKTNISGTMYYAKKMFETAVY